MVKIPLQPGRDRETLSPWKVRTVPGFCWRRPLTDLLLSVDGPVNLETYSPRFYTRIPTQRFTDLRAPLSDSRKVGIVNLIYRSDDAAAVLDLLRQYPPDNPGQTDYDILLDEQGHTALHLAASMARLQTVEALVDAGSDVNRGNYNGETPLIRSCLATAAFEHHCFHVIVSHLNKSVRTLDSSRKSVLHHIVSTAGIKARAVVARYYLDQVFYWIAHHQGGDFRSLINLQDENGDTALNISARVGNRSLVRALLDVGANKILPNKLGLRPGDFGVETEVTMRYDRARSSPKGLITSLVSPHRNFLVVHEQRTYWQPFVPLPLRPYKRATRS